MNFTGSSIKFQSRHHANNQTTGIAKKTPGTSEMDCKAKEVDETDLIMYFIVILSLTVMAYLRLAVAVLRQNQ